MPRTERDAYSPSRAVDGDMSTDFFSRAGIGNWLSVQVAASNRPIGLVAVYNTRNSRASYLGQFQLWMGSAPGEQGVLCGEASYDAASEPEPCTRRDD